MGGVITVGELVRFYLEMNRPIGIVVSDDTILAQAIKATRYYHGYGNLTYLDDDVMVQESTLLERSESAVITPLFELYVERENALILESSRALGVEVYGRTVSEISSDITQKELEIQNLAFAHEFFTV